MATTWVSPDADPGLRAAVDLSPVGTAISVYEDAIHADPATDTRLLGLVAARAAVLLGAATPPAGVDPDDLAALPQWPTDPRFGPRERAGLAFAEQWLMDASGVTDELCADLRAELGDAGAVAFTYGLSVVEATTRMSLALGTSS